MLLHSSIDQYTTLSNGTYYVIECAVVRPTGKRKATKQPPLTFASINTSIVGHLAIKYLNSKYISNLRTK